MKRLNFATLLNVFVFSAMVPAFGATKASDAAAKKAAEEKRLGALVVTAQQEVVRCVGGPTGSTRMFSAKLVAHRECQPSFQKYNSAQNAFKAVAGKSLTDLPSF